MVVTTSPIPLNPSTDLIDVMLTTFARNLDYSERIKVLIMCDGYSFSEIVDLASSEEEVNQSKDQTGVKKFLKQPKKQSWKKCRITRREAENYNEFIARLREKYEMSPVDGEDTWNTTSSENYTNKSIPKKGEPNTNIDLPLIRRRFEVQVVELGLENPAKPLQRTNYGFTNAVRYAVENLVKTPLVLVAQHDYVCVQGFPLRRVADVMLREGAVSEGAPSDTCPDDGTESPAESVPTESASQTTNTEKDALISIPEDDSKALSLRPEYVGFDCLTTTHYVDKIQRTSADDELECRPRYFDGLKFTPLYIWYDKTHLCHVEAYKRLFAWRHWKMGGFIEDDFFNEKLRSYPTFASYVLQQNDEPVIYHLSGRKLVEKNAEEEGNAKSSIAESMVVQLGRDQVEHLSSESVAVEDKEDLSEETQPYTANNRSVTESVLLPGGNPAHPYYPSSIEIGAKFSMFEQRATAGTDKRFTGKCFKCGEKGHSARFCPAEAAANDASANHAGS